MGEGADSVSPHGPLDRTPDPETHSEEGDEVEVIQAQIEETRAEMTETVDAIQEKLSPDHLKEQAKQTVRQATIGKASQAADAARSASTQAASRVGSAAKGAGAAATEKAQQPPVALAVGAFVLLGVGAGVLLIQGRRSAREAATQRYSSFTTRALGQVQESAGSAFGRARDTAGQLARRGQDGALQRAARSRDQVASDSAWQLLWDSRLAPSDLAAGLIVAVGLALLRRKRRTD